MNASGAADKVRVSIHVDVEPNVAFDVFTQEIDLWWRRGAAFRALGQTPSVIHLEPRQGGRIFEASGNAASALHEIGQITVWEPPSRLQLTWRALNFQPGETTTVEIWFAPERGGTTVTLEHRGWQSIRPDHPVRHGQGDRAFIRTMGMWWGELLRGVAERLQARPSTP
jgi:uncharacterized protein YndB with AHSA1/START domain